MGSIGESFALFLINIRRRNLKETLAVLLVAVFCLSMFSAFTLKVNAQQASGDYWIARAPLPVALGVEGAATVYGQIYVFGQDAHGNPLTYAYDPNTDSWNAKAPMPTSRTNFGLVACGDLIYAIGGVTGYNANGLAASTGVNEVYDPVSNTWSAKSSMPTNRSEVMAATVDGKIYVMGGRTAGADSTVNVTDIYDPATDSWTTGASMLYPVVLAAVAVVDTNIYVLNGQDEYYHSGSIVPNNNINININQIYDIATNSWSIGQSPAVDTRVAAGVSTTGVYASKRVYVIGGLDSSDSSSVANQIYNPETLSWSLGASFPTSHDYVTDTLAAVNLKDSIYVFGGIAQANEGFYEITEQYIPAGYNGTIIQPVNTAQPTSTPANSATASPSQSLTPSPSIPEFQAWIILVAILIATVPLALSIRKRNPSALRNTPVHRLRGAGDVSTSVGGSNLCSLPLTVGCKVHPLRVPQANRF
jgi:N-acetylneuraminic acid mutarotase